VAGTLDDRNDTGWAVMPQLGVEHAAIFQFKEPFGAGDRTPLVLTLEYKSTHNEHLIGRFRLSVTSDAVLAAGGAMPSKVRAALQAPAETRDDAQKKELAAYYRGISPLLEKARVELSGRESKLEEFEKKIRKCLVTKSGSPRTVRVLPRGNWLDATGEIVAPGVPAFMKPIEIAEKQRATRLDLAKWLVAREQPAHVPRVRQPPLEDALRHGAFEATRRPRRAGRVAGPSELLDWLAMEFVENGWDVKKSIKLLVTSSRLPPELEALEGALRERDPLQPA
jgi:hypothetical protein